MPLPPTCHCGIYMTVPHEHAPGLPKTGAPLMSTAELGNLFGASPGHDAAALVVERLLVQGMAAKLGEGLYKLTERGAGIVAEVQHLGADERSKALRERSGGAS